MKRVHPFVVFAKPDASTTSVGLPERWLREVRPLPAWLEGTLQLRQPVGQLGPLVELRASLLTSGLRVFISFRDRPHAASSSAADVVRSVVLLPSEERMALQPDRSVRSLGGPVYVSLQLLDGDRRAITETLDVGECVERGSRFRIPFPLGVSTTTWFAARDSSERGALVGVGGQVSVPRGLTARVMLRPLAGGRQGIGEGVAEVALVRPGWTWFAPDRNLVSGSPERAWVFARLAEASGRELGDEHLIGRVQLHSGT